jgi:hypothetical protein
MFTHEAPLALVILSAAKNLGCWLTTKASFLDSSLRSPENGGLGELFPRNPPLFSLAVVARRVMITQNDKVQLALFP